MCLHYYIVISYLYLLIVPEAPPTQPSNVTRPRPSTSTIYVVLPQPDQISTGEL